MHFLKISPIILMTLLLGVLAEEQYQNSSQLCSTCECQWINDKHTLRLDCVARNFEKTIANWPDETPEIVATFSRNNIRKLQQFPGSSSTLKLTFDHCNIEDMEPGLFESSINILYLDLSHNKITSDVLSTDVFKGPYNETTFQPIRIQYLNLAYNDIHTFHKNVFEHMPDLRYLNLEGNNFRVIDDLTTMAFTNIPNLRVLNIAYNRLTEVSHNVLKNFNDLTELDISNNDLDFVPMSLGPLTKLEILKIDNNPVITLDDQTFLGLANLLELSLRNLTGLQRVRTNTFAPCVKLQKLDLSQNRNLERIDEQAFIQSEKLKELNISNTKINTLMPNTLNWGELNVLDLSDNQFYCDCYLYNISLQLSEDIKRDKNGPYCKDTRNRISLEIYNLNEDVCKNKPYKADYLVRPYQTSPLLRMSLVLLTVVVIVASFVATVLCYTKWRTWHRNQSYPFASQVVYNPITTNVHF